MATIHPDDFDHPEELQTYSDDEFGADAVQALAAVSPAWVLIDLSVLLFAFLVARVVRTAGRI